MKPIVTVLTPVYNGLPFLIDSIESILSQSYKEFDYLIIDDASPDKKVVDCIKSFQDSRIKFVRNDENLGVCNTMNKALSLISTKYVIRQDHDDVSLPNRIEEQVDFLENHSEISIICSWEHTIDENNRRGRNWKSEINNYGEFLAPTLLGICPIWHPSIAFRTKAMKDVGGFRKEFTRAEDFEVTTRLALERHGASILKKYHLLQRQHNQRQSKEFEGEQVKISNLIQENALSSFNNNFKQLAPFLRLEISKKDNLSFKEYKIFMYKLLLELFDNVKEKKKMNQKEADSFKKVIFRRLGFGVFFMPYFNFLPSFLFRLLFYLLSPFYSKRLHRLLSNLFSFIYKFIQRFKQKVII